MACCMFAAFIVGHIVLMWRSIEARWFPRRAAARASRQTASAWRPGIATEPAFSNADPAPSLQLPRFVARAVGLTLIAVSLGYFAIQATDAWQRTDDAQSFAVLLAKNICRVAPDVNEKPMIRVAAANPK